MSHPHSVSNSPTSQPSQRFKAWVQSSLAIAAGYLFVALGCVALLSWLPLNASSAQPSMVWPPALLAQLCLATAGGYSTALLAPRFQSLAQHRSLIRHGVGLCAIAFLSWVAVAIAYGSVASTMPSIFMLLGLDLLAALTGISTGVWLRIRQR